MDINISDLYFITRSRERSLYRYAEISDLIICLVVEIGLSIVFNPRGYRYPDCCVNFVP